MAGMRYIVGLLIILAQPAPAEVKGGGRTIDCFCTDKAGARVELGQTVCLFVGGRAFLARCEMSLNVPMWRETGQGCIASSLDIPNPGFSIDAGTDTVRTNG